MANTSFKLPSAHIPNWLDKVDISTADSRYKSKIQEFSKLQKIKITHKVAWVFQRILKVF